MDDFKLSAELIARAKHGRDFIIGVDLGQARDYTAIAILERFEELTGEAAKGRWLTQVRYEMPHLERPPLGTSYPAIIDRLKDLIARLPAHERLRILVDRTGCGRPVVDLMRKEKLSVIPITITAGGSVTGGSFGGYNVPKRELVSNLAILFQSARLKISRALPEAPQLIEELQNFKMKITLAGNDTYEAWRESDHDDLVLAAAMAAWYGEKKLHSILHLPPMPRAPIEARQPTLDELIKMQPKSGGDGRRDRL
ncbi:MAG: hypothetical protein IID48_06265 [Proteobacteria bacterium]|nr:hypothetical protein [Pseudomonadota bacterium]